MYCCIGICPLGAETACFLFPCVQKLKAGIHKKKYRGYKQQLFSDIIIFFIQIRQFRWRLYVKGSVDTGLDAFP
jgi:hypothetical protein